MNLNAQNTSDWLDFVPDDVIARRYDLAKALRQDTPATSWAGIIANGLGALGGSLVEGSANRALMDNQALRAREVSGIANATDPGSLAKTLLNARTPDLQTLGLKAKIQQVSDDPYKEYRVRDTIAKQYGLVPGTQQYRDFVLTGKSMSNGEMFGKAGAIFQDPASGKFYSIQFGGDGRKLVEEIKAPEGASLAPAKGIREIDTGTGTQIVSGATGAPIREVSKDLVGKKSAEVVGEETGKALGNLPTALNNSEKIVRTIDAVLNDPYLDHMVGPIQGRLPNLSGRAQNLQALIDQIQGQAFLQAYNTLRGGGQITEAEGAKATASLNRLQNTKVGTPQWIAAAKEFRNDVVDLANIARRKAAGNYQPLPTPNIDSGGLPRPSSKSEYDALPSGTRFYDPDGNIRIKP